ncbi:MAG: acyl-[acyl-carrier-protein]--UDP-N-acetylglucosamine O-acyltransferase, partial [Myxococcota bacterium]|nr:acyl-[acyl-carrier-protein]--UDP-N-acetylglucosamine O-acyltransferase [Myxococcota bacterium]
MGIHKTAIVDKAATLGDVEVGAYAIIGPNVTLEDGVVVDAHAVVYGPTTIGKGCRIHAFACLGGDPQDRRYEGEATALEVGSHNVFREYVTVSRGTASGGGITRIGDHNLFMTHAHVGHDGVVGSHCVLANS